ncbi:hypothetical protein ALC57_10363 [Trachymyrmex cornetzi]|uniref:Uncharacterized protein n=1 Tax=Trachymyrmex cornetzi TaxID=471704 RepID=A0A195DXE6_9HYME|nr:hypothetical protein ALC57_10363 [Trachymyrmex cornetzi]
MRLKDNKKIRELIESERKVLIKRGKREREASRYTNARIANAVTTVRAAIPDARVIFILEMLTILFPSRIDERERAPPSNCTIFYFPSRTMIG